MRRESWLVISLVVLILCLPAGLAIFVDDITLFGGSKGSVNVSDRDGGEPTVVRLDRKPSALVTGALFLTDESGTHRTIVAHFVLSSTAYVSQACVTEAHVMASMRLYLDENPDLIPNETTPRTRPDKRLIRRLEQVIGPESIDSIGLQLVDQHIPHGKAQLHSCHDGVVREGLS